jgi:hypothetical protein
VRVREVASLDVIEEGRAVRRFRLARLARAEAIRENCGGQARINHRGPL